MTFEWDSTKDAINLDKHGVSFSEAQRAFQDPDRIISNDRKHSTGSETRFFCFGKVDGQILTVRFTYRQEKIRIFGAGYWREGSDMKNNRSYVEAPAEIGEAIMQSEIIEDFLPPPEQLILKEETVKVTLNLNKDSVAFLKEEAEVQGVPYQQMIRRIIDLYTQHYRKHVV